MKNICFHPRTASILTAPRIAPSGCTSSATRRESTLVKIIDSAEPLIMKWNPDSSIYTRITSLFYTDKTEAAEFVKCVNDLEKAMNLLAVSDSGASPKLLKAQNLMRIAMKRLEKEFNQILIINRAQLDPESISVGSSTTTDCYSWDGSTNDEIRLAGETIIEVEQASSISMADLRSIAECMIGSGYEKECTNIYIRIRKTIIEEGVYRLGVQRLNASQINKMDWEVLELKIKIWLEVVKISMRSLFTGERILCDHVFAASDAARESCFGAISRDGAAVLFGFPEIVATRKKSAEKLFRTLDMYAAMSEHLPEIDSIFAFDSTSIVRSQARNSISRLGESVRDILTDFETAIQKDSSKSRVSNCGIHPLTVYAMDYLSILADYSQIAADIFVNWPPVVTTSLPESFFSNPNSGPASAVSRHAAWLLLVLLCKLDGKAEYVDSMSLSYLFLANNLQYVVRKVRGSNLQYLIGEEWIVGHENKVRHYAASYERLGWSRVYETLPEDPTAAMTTAEAKVRFVKFNSSFEEAYRKHNWSVIPDPKLRDEIRVSIERKLLVRGYKMFYDVHRVSVGRERNGVICVRYAPEEIRNYLSDLFFGSIDQGTTSPDGHKQGTSPTSSPSSLSSSHWRRLMFRRCNSSR